MRELNENELEDVGGGFFIAAAVGLALLMNNYNFGFYQRNGINYVAGPNVPWWATNPAPAASLRRTG